MGPIKIYHNPRCSKSRATLALLEENGISPEIVYYLESPPDIEELKSLLEKLDIGVRELMRKGEAEYEQLGLDDDSLSDEILLEFVAKHPKLIQRPIVIKGDEALFGRPPENVLQLLEK